MPPLVTGLLVKNEADRYLRRVLERCAQFSDRILVLDDRSTDGTGALAKGLGCEVRTRSVLEDPAWGKEAPARKELWDWGAEVCGADGWLLICDADMLLEGDPRPYTETWDLNTWSFILYDLWDSESTYRQDGYWQAHRVPRPWLFRPGLVPLGWRPEWPARGIHCGHCPQNWTALTGYAESLRYLHLAYVKPEDRVRKSRAYMERSAQLTPFERAHAESILAAP